MWIPPKNAPYAEVRDLVRERRKHPTDAKAKAWSFLRARRTLGLKFRREHLLQEGYVVDFYCPEHKLVVEIDDLATSHHKTGARHIDRYEELGDLGYKVVVIFHGDVSRHFLQVVIAMETGIDLRKTA